MADLKTNYVDDVLDSSKNQLRKYQQIQNDDGTVSFVDVTEYSTTGTSFGAKDINDTNAAVNALNESLNSLFVINVKTLTPSTEIASKNYGYINFNATSDIPDGYKIFDIFCTSNMPVGVSVADNGTSYQVIINNNTDIARKPTIKVYINCIKTN